MSFAGGGERHGKVLKCLGVCPGRLLGNVAKLRPARRKLDRPDDRFLDEFFDPPVGFYIENAQLDDLNRLTDRINLNQSGAWYAEAVDRAMISKLENIRVLKNSADGQGEICHG